MKFIDVKDDCCFRAKILWEMEVENPDENKGEYRYFTLLDLIKAEVDSYENTICIGDIVCDLYSLQRKVGDEYSMTKVIND